jgi:hypothetical protein
VFGFDPAYDLFLKTATSLISSTALALFPYAEKVSIPEDP